jgi:hypothetical protein
MEFKLPGRNIYAEYIYEKKREKKKGSLGTKGIIEKVEQDSIISPRRAGIRSRPIDPGKSAPRHPPFPNTQVLVWGGYSGIFGGEREGNNRHRNMVYR